MKILYLFLFAIVWVHCKNTPETEEASFRKKHLFFSADSTYTIKLGSTIAFGYSETEGIDRSRYPAPRYDRKLDTAYFKFVEKKSFYPEGCTGCASTNYSIFKAIQKGTTQVQATKTTYLQNSKQVKQEDTTVVIGNYQIIIK